MAGHEPRRRCAGCGRSAPKGALLRLALDGDRVVLDRAARRPGRGVYVCSAGPCLEKAVRGGGLVRGFRRAVKLQPESLESNV
ncbi:MAG: YlxR family protein [Actinobacteria bacterium]|nr:MAG: YlxR family protein [Actinomycetota bacterium]